MFDLNQSVSGPMVGMKGRMLSVAAGLALVCAAPSVLAQAIVSGFDANVFARNDDLSLSNIPLGFNINFFGTTYSTAFINNNGNITFDASLGTFSPFVIASAERVMIAPFFADVDTRNSGLPVTYGPGTFAGRPAFGVNWRNVDYFASAASRTNQNFFQLLLVNRSDVVAGDFDIVFTEKKMTAHHPVEA